MYNAAQTLAKGIPDEAGESASYVRYITASYVLAPVLFEYVRFVLTNAMLMRKRRLYFLSRDGYLMYRIANFLCQIYELPLECKYLYCSRYALRSAEYALLDEKSLDYICLGGMQVTFESMMKRAGLTGEEMLETARRLGKIADGKMLSEVSMLRQSLTAAQILHLKEKLRNSPYFMDRLTAHAEDAYPQVTAYLKQEGILNDDSFLIVDSGWTGSIQKSMQHLFLSCGSIQTVEGFYFGLYELPEDVIPETYHSFFFSPEKDNKNKAFFCNNLFECIFSSPEGMCCGYQKKNGRFEPVLVTAENPKAEEIEALEALLMQYVNAYAEQPDSKLDFLYAPVQRTVLQKLLRSLMWNPCPEEAEFFSTYRFCDDVMGEENTCVAKEMDLHSLRMENNAFRRLLLYLFQKERTAPFSAWPEGCIALTQGAGTYDRINTALYRYMLFTRKSLEQRRRK